MKYKETDPVRLSDDRESIIIIDQSKLPGEVSYLNISTLEQMYDAIKTLAVRGAPCIGVFAGYCMALLADRKLYSDPAAFEGSLKEAGAYLESSRPTAVNLSWAVQRQLNVVRSGIDSGMSPDKIKDRLYDEAVSIHEEDISMCMRIAEHGLSLLDYGDGILTHCNAGPLATSKYGTAIGPMLLGKERGIDFKVFADETRPLLQGARLTAFELSKADIDVTLICDSMANQVMKNGWVDAVLVGCDRMAANGDGANKIGTNGLAILAKEYNIPFYMFVPTSSLDLDTPTGDDIEIELRDGEEIYKMWYEKPMAPEGIKTYNPSFDVTPAEYITAIVTEKGIVRPPFAENLRKIKETD